MHFRMMLGRGYSLGTGTTTYSQSGRPVEALVRVLCVDTCLTRSCSTGPCLAVPLRSVVRSLSEERAPSEEAGLVAGTPKPQISTGGLGLCLG